MRSIITLLILLIASSQALAGERERSITVLAEGYVEAVPDTLSFSVTIKKTRPSLGEARAAVGPVVASALAQARALGIPLEDIDSSAMQAFPEYEWRKQEKLYRGESVVRTVSFTLREMDRYPALVKQLGELDVQQIGRPQLSHSNIDQLRLDALRAALQRGKTKAATIADGVDADLGEVLSVSESYRNQPQPRMMMAEAAGASDDGSYNVGKRRISARVEMRFALK